MKRLKSSSKSYRYRRVVLRAEKDGASVLARTWFLLDSEGKNIARELVSRGTNVGLAIQQAYIFGTWAVKAL